MSAVASHTHDVVSELAADKPAVISVRGVSKCYHVYDRPQDRLKQALIPRVNWLLRPLGGRGARTYFREFWALRDVSLEIGSGETLGILGRNGAGKSTLLQIIAGTLAPTYGEARVLGRVAALLELGSGFNPEFTGRENVYLNASLFGLTVQDTRAKFDQIAAFAEIGDFLDQPVKTYSSGMMMRLAFAVQTAVDPQVLIVDEALAVGDARFQKKCYERLDRFREAGGTILFVTHDAGAVVQHCTRAVILDAGRIIESGEPHYVVKAYHKLLFGAETAGPTEAKQDAATASAPCSVDQPGDQPASGEAGRREVSYGSGEVVITRAGIRDAEGRDTTLLELGEDYVFYLQGRFDAAYEGKVAFGFIITNVKGVEIYGTNGQLHGQTIPPGSADQRFECRMRVRATLVPGVYFATVALAPEVGSTPAGSAFFHYRFDAIEFRVVGVPRCFTTSVTDLDADLEMTLL